METELWEYFADKLIEELVERVRREHDGDRLSIYELESFCEDRIDKLVPRILDRCFADE